MARCPYSSTEVQAHAGWFRFNSMDLHSLPRRTTTFSSCSSSSLIRSESSLSSWVHSQPHIHTFIIYALHVFVWIRSRDVLLICLNLIGFRLHHTLTPRALIISSFISDYIQHKKTLIASEFNLCMVLLKASIYSYHSIQKLQFLFMGWSLCCTLSKPSFLLGRL